MVDLDAVREVANSSSAGVVWGAIGVGDDYHSMAAVNKFL